MELKFNGDKLRELRLERNMTMEELADQIGMSQSNISNIETNKKTSPRSGTVEKISKIFNVNPIIFYIDKNTAAALLNMDVKLSEFVTDQKNQKYLKMAVKLKEMGMTDELLDSMQIMITKSREVRYFLSHKTE